METLLRIRYKVLVNHQLLLLYNHPVPRLSGELNKSKSSGKMEAR